MLNASTRNSNDFESVTRSHFVSVMVKVIDSAIVEKPPEHVPELPKRPRGQGRRVELVPAVSRIGINMQRRPTVLRRVQQVVVMPFPSVPSSELFESLY